MAKDKGVSPTAASAADDASPIDPFAHAGDPFWGRGGTYVVDPATGARTPASPAASAASVIEDSKE